MNRSNDAINQGTVIKKAINSCLEKGLTDKKDIYTKVVDELGVPRPTVRRVARDLRNDLQVELQGLESDQPAKKAARALRDKLLQKISILQSEARLENTVQQAN
ncbi:hypothetical protein CENSYa_1439 [Cenarchaeum symbiosum A]|uniref:Uncharacterized protein n=1 Tax=Cenarchaeum symbiosum (strain A) TaxID=414004 RepID=A0RXJ4_CENSY|nr:hypothetical protein CENSYa_1439 [Cenarchaeum symbiosum A]